MPDATEPGDQAIAELRTSLALREQTCAELEKQNDNLRDRCEALAARTEEAEAALRDEIGVSQRHELVAEEATARVAALEGALNDYVLMAQVAKQSTKNPNTTFIDTRDWEIAQSRTRAALAPATEKQHE